MAKRKFSKKSSKKRSFKKRFKTPYGARKRYNSKKRHRRRYDTVSRMFPPSKQVLLKTNATYSINGDSSYSWVDIQPGLLMYPWNPPAASYTYNTTPNHMQEGTPVPASNFYVGLSKLYSADVAKGMYRYAKVYGFKYEVEADMHSLITAGHFSVSLWTVSQGVTGAPLYPLESNWDVEGRRFCKVKPYKPGGKAVIRGFVKMYKALGWTKQQWLSAPPTFNVQSVTTEPAERVGVRIIFETGNGLGFDQNTTQHIDATVRVRVWTYATLMQESSNNIGRSLAI